MIDSARPVLFFDALSNSSRFRGNQLVGRVGGFEVQSFGVHGNRRGHTGQLDRRPYGHLGEHHRVVCTIAELLRLRTVIAIGVLTHAN